MVESITNLIQTLNALQDQIRVENVKYELYLKTNQRGKAQASQVHLKNLLKKRYNLYSRLKAKLGGFAIKISYEYASNNSEEYHKETAHLVNITEEEAKEILTLGLTQKGYKIRILETRKIPTFLSKGKL